MDQMFQIGDSILTVSLPVELDHPNSQAISQQIDEILQEQYIRGIVFDFGNTTFMDSSGIGMIMGRYKALGMRQDSIRAIRVNRRIYKILNLSGIYKGREIFFAPLCVPGTVQSPCKSGRISRAFRQINASMPCFVSQRYTRPCGVVPMR